jgi:hypothetical protein
MSVAGKVLVYALSFGPFAAGCAQRPQTLVILDNDYPPSQTAPLVVYRAYWQAVSFQSPVAPGAESDPQSTVPASDNTAYVILAPGWDPDAGPARPTSFVFMQSRSSFDVHQGDTLHIPVDDGTFIGNCASGSFLSQTQADFIIQRIFVPAIFPDASAPFAYDAATCTTTPIGDAGAP